ADVVLLAVRVGQRLEHLHGDVERELDGEALPLLAHALEQPPEILAVHELEGDPVVAVEGTGVVDLRDRAVLELEEGAHLVLEAGDELVVAREPGEDPLDHAEAVEAALEGGARQVDLAHPARAQGGEEGEAPEGLRSEGPDRRAGLEVLAHSEAPKSSQISTGSWRPRSVRGPRSRLSTRSGRAASTSARETMICSGAASATRREATFTVSPRAV